MRKADFLCDSRAKRLFSAGILNTTEDFPSGSVLPAMRKAGFLCDSRAKRLFSAGILNTIEDLGDRGEEVPLYCSGMGPRRPPPDLRHPCRGFCQRPAQRAVFMRNWKRGRAAARDLGVVRRGSSIGVAQIGGDPAGPPPQTATLSSIPTPTPPDPRRQGHLYFGAAPFACGSAMIFFKSRYLRHFCGATSELSQHCRESGVPHSQK